MINGEKYLPRVPSEYQEVAYLQNSGTQYIDTGLIGTDLYGCEIEITMSNESDVTTQYNFNGAYKSGNAVQLGLVATSATECRASMNFGFIDAASMSGLSNHQFHTLYLSDGLQKVDNVRIGTSSYGTASSLRFFLFAREQETTPVINYCVAMKLKAFSVKKNGQYIRNMISVRRISDSVLGLYDTANNVFYTNQGTGTFTAGADVSPWHDTPIPTRKLHSKTDVITSLPTDIYTEGQTIGVNLLNTTDTQQTFPNGTYYIYSNSPDASINYYDTNNPEQRYGIINDGDIFTPTGSLGVSVSSADKLKQCMVAKSSTDVPFQPYSNCTIIGNMQQTGTPTPQNPIQPSETGDMTGNLCSNIAYKTNYSINAQGVETAFQGFNIYAIPCEANTTYTISLSSFLSGTTVRIHTYNNGVWIEQTAYASIQSLPLTFTTPNNSDEIRISITNNANNKIMLNEGSTALPYEPYGYKLDIKSGNTTTPVYLGEVETTRKIKQLVLTGQEDWTQHQTLLSWFRLLLPAAQIVSGIEICSHYKPSVNTPATIQNGEILVNENIGEKRIIIKDTTFSTVTEFTNFLQQQYAAGTPVCVWYVLTTPTTGIVNEPLRKIGDYADSVIATNIPTTAGGIEFDVDTSLKPSEIDLTYHGWHDISPLQRVNGQWV